MTRLSRSLPVVLLLTTWAGILVSCGSGDAAIQESRAMNDTMSTLQTNQPAPYGHLRSDAREALIQIEETMIDSSADTYHYVLAPMDGHPIFSCVGKGLGIPDTAELSNPEQIINPYGSAYITMPQADPYGYYAPPSSQGTYILCNEKDGTQYLQRWEVPVGTSTVPLRWDAASQSYQVAGTSAVHIDLNRTDKKRAPITPTP